MLWIIWDILVPLLTSFALGILLGWLLWRWRKRMVHANGSQSPLMHLEADLPDSNSTDNPDQHEMDSQALPTSGEDEPVVQKSNTSREYPEANIALIEERDLAQTQRDQLQTENDTLLQRVQTLEATVVAAEETSADKQPVAADSDELDARVKEQLDNLTHTIETERRQKREMELELLNAANRYEKLEVQSAGIDDSGLWRQQLEAQQQKSNELKASLQTLEVKHAKLQADMEKTRQEAHHSSDTLQSKELEIGQLKSSLDKKPQVPVGISAARHQQEISIRNAQIESLKRRLERQHEQSLLAKEQSNNVSTVNVTVSANEPASTAGASTSTEAAPRTSNDDEVRDALTEIKGVGPVLEKQLHQAGVYCYRQIALLDKKGIDNLQQKLPQFPGRIQRDQWVRQAKKLHKAKYGVAAV